MISKLIRRTHMYLALFLSPWVLMYTLSTMAMNHREFLRDLAGGGPPAFVTEREMPYQLSETDPKAAAERILGDLGMHGAYSAGKPQADGTLVIQRLDPVALRRITWQPAARTVKVERQQFQTSAFLERMHRRRGYQHDVALEDGWAFSVDLFIAAMILWGASGLWMWWEMRVTRRTGALVALGGLGLFVFFLFAM